MKKTLFDTEFQRLTTEMVEVAFEYIGFNKEEVDGIYIYGSMEQGIFFYNVFYKINHQLVKKEKVNDVLTNKVDDSDKIIRALLSFGGEALMDLSDVFTDDSREVPTLLKMVYRPKTGGFNCDILYDPQYSDHETRTNTEGFNDWFNQEKQQQNN